MRLGFVDPTMEETPQPVVKAQCKRCLASDPTWLIDHTTGVVSPSGIEHIGQSDGETLCGIDAKPDGWWWPL